MILPILEFKKATQQERLDKLTEEYTEVMNAVRQNAPLEETLSEYMDIIQVCITNMYQIAKNEEVEQAVTTHQIKMIDRGYDVKGCLAVRFI
jgi:NTP pyrophosphatase (non-canonical NTP hydrolase)